MFLRVQSPLPPDQEQIITQTIDVGFSVHRELGPGFRECIYEQAFCLELDARGISFEREKRIDVRYKQWTIPGQKLDLLVGGVVIVELKAVPRVRRIHGAQLLSYMRTTGIRVGLLMNFNESLFKKGLKRFAL